MDLYEHTPEDHDGTDSPTEFDGRMMRRAELIDEINGLNEDVDALRRQLWEGMDALQSIAGKQRPSGAYCQRVARIALRRLGVDPSAGRVASESQDADAPGSDAP